MGGNASKGFALGCLASLAAMLMGVFGFLFVMGMAFRGCADAAANGVADGGAASSGAKEQKRPEDVGSFKKTWVDGVGGAKAPKAPKVLRIPLTGVILSSDRRRGFFDVAEDGSAPAALRKIRAAVEDDEIDGLFLCIDSPGGGVTASDELHHAVRRFRESRKGRFAFVLMGDMCCSGGYYVACAADFVMARPTSLTGSIGVLLNGVNAAELVRKIGVAPVTVVSGKNKDLLNPLKPVDSGHVEIVQKAVDQMHRRFVSIVAEGRRMDERKAGELADGRVFSAADALANGLVDAVGYREDALERLRALAGDRDVCVVRYQEVESFRRIFSNAMVFSSVGDLAREVVSALDASPSVQYLAPIGGSGR